MLSKIDFDRIDNFFISQKQISNNIVWQRDGNKNSQCAVIQLFYENDNIFELLIDFRFNAKVNYYVSLNELDTGTLIILYKNIVITRMHINPGNIHTNPYIDSKYFKDESIHLKKFERGITRFYPWKYRKLELENNIIDSKTAIQVKNLKNFNDCFDFFKKECNIIGEIPLPQLSETLL